MGPPGKGAAPKGAGKGAAAAAGKGAAPAAGKGAKAGAEGKGGKPAAKGKGAKASPAAASLSPSRAASEPADSRASSPAPLPLQASPPPDGESALRRQTEELQRHVDALKEEVAQLRTLSPLRRQRELADPMLGLFIDKLRHVYDRAAAAGPVTRAGMMAAMQADPDVRWHSTLAQRSPSAGAGSDAALTQPHGGAALYGRVLRALDLSESGIDAPALRAVHSSRLTFADLCEIVGGAWEPATGGACGVAEERAAALYDAALAAHRKRHGSNAVLPRSAVAAAIRGDPRVRSAAAEGVGFLRLLLLLEGEDPAAGIDWRELRELFPAAFSQPPIDAPEGGPPQIPL